MESLAEISWKFPDDAKVPNPCVALPVKGEKVVTHKPQVTLTAHSMAGPATGSCPNSEDLIPNHRLGMVTWLAECVCMCMCVCLCV